LLPHAGVARALALVSDVIGMNRLAPAAFPGILGGLSWWWITGILLARPPGPRLLGAIPAHGELLALRVPASGTAEIIRPLRFAIVPDLQ
jgi:hypothetical protein